MTKDIGINTSLALAGAPTNGLVTRDFVTVFAKNRSTGDIDELCLWNGRVPLDAPVVKPSNGASDIRSFQAMGALLKIGPIPASLSLEIRTVRVELSKISDAALNIIRTYDAQMAEIQIHRGQFDLVTRQLVDPALCRFRGFINNAPIKTPKSGGSGGISVECVSIARILTRTSGQNFSDELMKERSGDRFARDVDVDGDWRIWWGQDEHVVGNRRTKPKERFFRV
jgi:hypothetical protein